MGDRNARRVRAPVRARNLVRIGNERFASIIRRVDQVSSRNERSTAYARREERGDRPHLLGERRANDPLHAPRLERRLTQTGTDTMDWVRISVSRGRSSSLPSRTAALSPVARARCLRESPSANSTPRVRFSATRARAANDDGTNADHRARVGRRVKTTN
jgi:hypothetical protein